MYRRIRIAVTLCLVIIVVSVLPTASASASWPKWVLDLLAAGWTMYNRECLEIPVDEYTTVECKLNYYVCEDFIVPYAKYEHITKVYEKWCKLEICDPVAGLLCYDVWGEPRFIENVYKTESWVRGCCDPQEAGCGDPWACPTVIHEEACALPYTQDYWETYQGLLSRLTDTMAG